MARISAQQVIDTVLDHGSFTSWDGAPEHGNIDESYRGTLSRASEKTGLDEAVITGEGTVGGKRVAVICSEFGFLGGSIGAATSSARLRSSCPCCSPRPRAALACRRALRRSRS